MVSHFSIAQTHNSSAVPLLSDISNIDDYEMEDPSIKKTQLADPNSSDDVLTPQSLHDLDLPGSTPYERKCALINREIDSHGMGRYQWKIWILCGFGYLVDLLWAQAFGLVLKPIQQEFGFNSQCLP